MTELLKHIGVDRFLGEQKLMSIRPFSNDEITLQGWFKLYATVENGTDIKDVYNLKIIIPNSYPGDIPKVWELENIITPQIANDHIFKDRSLCLGSPFTIAEFIKNNPKFSDYIEKFLVPFLYAISYRRNFGGEMIFGELDHGFPGIVDDFLNFNNSQKLEESLKLISLKKRIANKKRCPCGCGNRLGACNLHFRINLLRKLKCQFNKSKAPDSKHIDASVRTNNVSF